MFEEVDVGEGADKRRERRYVVSVEDERRFEGGRGGGGGKVEDERRGVSFSSSSWDGGKSGLAMQQSG